MDSKSLDHFGNVLISAVRDQTIMHWNQIIIGRMKDEGSQKIYNELINGFSKSQIDTLSNVISQVVDSALHSFLVMIEQEDSIEVLVRTGENILPIKIKELSDGLAGELYTEDGWIMKYSTEPYIEP